MKQKEFEKLENGNKVSHKHLGVCTVVDYIPDFGPVLSPDTKEGKRALYCMSGVYAPLLETSNRLIQMINV